MSASTKFTFPHETLTPIIGKPTNTTLQLLQRQLYANARSVPSSRGGGVHGHLALLLSDEDYLARAGIAFIVPVHSGPPPLPVGAAAVIAVALRVYTDTIADVTLYNNLNAALTAQILSAVKNASFLSALEDPDYGFSDVSPRYMLIHLRDEYGTLTPEELEKNRASLLEPWNLDDPIEDLWLGENCEHSARCHFRQRPHYRHHNHHTHFGDDRENGFARYNDGKISSPST
jgi:hypothetical protein